MALTPSDVASLTNAVASWERAEYLSCTLVVIACFGEFAAEFTNWFTGGDEDRKKALAKHSTLLLIVSLAFELICLVKTNQLSGLLIGSLNDIAEEASKKSAQAVIDADAAIGKAKSAETVARSAREQADSFEKRIVSATDTAIKAESHLADALEHTARLERQLAWREIDSEQRARLSAKLARFTGQLFDMATFESEPECVNFENELYRNMLAGKWLLDPKREWHALMEMVIGVRMVVSANAHGQTRAAAGALVEALKAESIEASIISAGPKETWPAPNVVAVQVGKNPNSTHPISPPK